MLNIKSYLLPFIKMNEGWIKIHRKLRDNPIYNNSIAVHCWIECLLRSNHDDNSFYFNREKITISRGQFITGRIEFSKSVNQKPSTVWFWLKQFQNEQMIDIKSTNKYSVITILNWLDYQQLDNRQTTDRQQIDTNKNDKNDKNIYNSKNYLLKIPDKDKELISKELGITKENIIFKGKILYDWCESKGKVYKNYKAFLKNCLRSDIDKENKSKQIINFGGKNYADIKNNQ